LVVGRLVAGGGDWQIYERSEGGRVLVANAEIAERWVSSGCLTPSDLLQFDFGSQGLRVLDGGADHVLAPLDRCRAPYDKSEALAFAAAMRETRRAGEDASLGGGIYAERVSRILPTYTGSEGADDALILGMWLSGGLRVSAVPGDRLRGLLTWLPTSHLHQVLDAAGLKACNVLVAEGFESSAHRREGSSQPATEGRFSLPGRALLETFFNDHVIDVVQNRELYRKLGLGNPPAIVLEGPPGSGKTVAVERLLDFLGWPAFSVDAETIASPYIHETSRKVSSLFKDAIDAAPSAIVIDEMDAFLSERDSGPSSQHRVEEVAEFLRRIPEAISAGVLVIGMTNRLDVIDAAVLRRGRFDHVVRVDYADADEVAALLRSMTEGLPLAEGLDINGYGKRLAGRPLSDASFLIREGARVTARNRQNLIDASSLDAALATLERKDSEVRREPIGFVTRRSE
jgi:hypothetical protein